jgi:hypothetical protein
MRLGLPFFALLGAGCSLANAIDVCEREGPMEREINRRSEGDQAIVSENAMVPRPSGGAFVAFTSQQIDGDVMTSEVRGTLLGPDGAASTTCDGPEEVTYAEAPAAAVTVAPAASEDAHMLAAWVVPSEEKHELWVRPIDTSGCASGDPFRVDVDPVDDEGQVATHYVVRPDVVALGPPNQFAVLWGEISTDPLQLGAAILGRIVDMSTPSFPRFLATPDNLEGDPVELMRVSALSKIAAVPVGEQRFALAWIDVEGFEAFVRVAAWTDRLEPVFEPVLVEDLDESRAAVVAPALSVGWDGTQLLVGWRQADGESHRAYGRFFDLEGHALRGALSDDGESFRLGTRDGGNEIDVTVTAAPDGGFVAAWTADGDVHGVWLDALGERLFANRACDRSDFPLNRVRGGDQEWPSLAWLTDGTLVAAWTDGGKSGSDPSGTAVRAVRLESRDLLDIE